MSNNKLEDHCTTVVCSLKYLQAQRKLYLFFLCCTSLRRKFCLQLIRLLPDFASRLLPDWFHILLPDCFCWWTTWLLSFSVTDSMSSDRRNSVCWFDVWHLTSTDLQGTPLRAHDVSQLVGPSGGMFWWVSLNFLHMMMVHQVDINHMCCWWRRSLNFLHVMAHWV